MILLLSAVSLILWFINAVFLMPFFRTVTYGGCGPPNPCGPNTECFEAYSSSEPTCECLPGFIRAPSPQAGCIKPPAVEPNLCQPGPCARNADCFVQNRREECSCKPGYTGNPFKSCQPIKQRDPCNPSPCGENTQCNVDLSGNAICSCLPGYEGEPLLAQGCQPECVLQNDCPYTEACINYKCVDPCPGSCGVQAHCTVVDHNPICNCPKGFEGDPFFRCERIPELPSRPKDPCNPSPCGTNTQCTVLDGGAVCECMNDYIGDPLSSCKPECILSSECPAHLACINMKCKDPCPGACGSNADCRVIRNHNPTCTCREGYTGDPFVGCTIARKFYYIYFA